MRNLDESPTVGKPTANSSWRYWVVVASHFCVDLYPMFVVALVAALQHRLGLTEMQAALLISLNGVISGLAQPIFAWFGDRFNTRLFGAVGLALGAMAMSSVGFAHTFSQLLIIQIVGMAGVGVFHPVSSALAGRLGRDAFDSAHKKRSARGLGLAIFFAAGVGGGGFLGPLIVTRINAQTYFDVDGMKLLAFMAIPGVVMALTLWLATRHVPHRDSATGARRDATLLGVASERQRWIAVGLLFLSNTLRFTVTLGLFYLYKRWAEERLGTEASAQSVASLHANILSAAQIGMGVSALALGHFVTHGRERRAMMLTAWLTAPVVMLMPNLGVGGMLLASGVAAFGYFGVIPTSLALAQRLLPHATGVTGSILMGAGWAISSIGPIMAERIVKTAGLERAFFVFGAIMALAGVVSMLISKRLIRSAAALG